MKHANIPIFIPHLGCPNNCVFCNQKRISGKLSFCREDVARDIETALSTIREGTETEIAFFGGSFTGIDRELMIYLLETANKYIKSGRVGAIRVSTRPDYIDEEIIAILKQYNVATVELGIQSVDDKVLEASRRGHTLECTKRACALVVGAGITLVGQMMIGLPAANLESELATAEFISSCGATAARVYPTVVFADTPLCDIAREGKYTPLTNETAVERTKEVLKVFDRHNIQVIRVGLCASEQLVSKEAVYAGANDPAIGERAMSAVFFDKICGEIDSNGIETAGKIIKIEAAPGTTSKIIGQNRENIAKLREKYSLKDVKVIEKRDLIRYNIKIVI